MLKNLLVVFALVVSSAGTVAAEHHNLNVNACNVTATGNVTVHGISDSDNAQRNITYAQPFLTEKTLDRYLSVCMASLMSGKKLRAIYIDCTGAECTVVNGSSLKVFE